MEFRHFREADYSAVCDFLVALNREDRKHVNWNWARFEWMYEHPECDKSALGSIGLWLEDGRVVGAAIYDMYFGEALCAALPEYDALLPRVLDYAWQALRDEKGLGIAVCEDDPALLRAAEEAGFAPAGHAEMVMVRRLDGPLSAQLPEGLSFRDMDQEADLPALQWLFWQGFDHGADWEEFLREGTAAPRRRMHFRRELSVAAVTPEGEPVAFCGLWYLEGTDYAYVEPVCTVPAWRGKGAGRAVVLEALERARSLGARRAYVISDQVFYEKLGFTLFRRFPFYWKT